MSFISKFMLAPKVEHWTIAKWLLRYVKGTLHFGILNNRSKDPRLSGYTDSNWAGSIDDRKSTYGYVFSLGTGAVAWTNKKQHAVALSSTKPKYWGVVKGACEAVWLRQILLYLQMQQTKPTPIFFDNQGVIKLAKNPVFHERTKLVEVHCHFNRQLVEDGSCRAAVLSYRGTNYRHSHQGFGSWKICKISR